MGVLQVNQGDPGSARPFAPVRFGYTHSEPTEPHGPETKGWPRCNLTLPTLDAREVIFMHALRVLEAG